MLPDRFNRTPVWKPNVPLSIVALVSTMNELIEILGAEPDLVLQRKFDAHEKLVKRKQKLAMEYRTSIKSIAAQPEMIKKLPDEVRRRLKMTAQRLADQAEINARSLRAAVTAVQRLIQNIVAFVKSEVLTIPGYKNPKSAYLELGTYSPTCKPVAVSRTA